jgi:hypothetical protein
LNLELSQLPAHAVQIKPDDFAGYPDGWNEPTASQPQDDLALYAKIIRDNIIRPELILRSIYCVPHRKFLKGRTSFFRWTKIYGWFYASH